MSFESDFLDLMPSTIKRNAFLRRSTDGYGGPRYSTTSTQSMRARVVRNSTLQVILQGQTITPDLVAWAESTASLNVQDKFTYAGTTYRCVGIEQPTDETGIHHTKLLLRGG